MTMKDASKKKARALPEQLVLQPYEDIASALANREKESA